MKLPFKIISRKQYDELVSMRDYYHQQLKEFRSANISLGEQVRNLHYNYGLVSRQLEEKTQEVNRLTNQYNRLKKKMK